MKFILTTVFSLFTVAVFSQDTTYYTKADSKTIFKDSAEYHWVKFVNPTDSIKVILTRYLRTGNIVAVQSFSDYKNTILGGKMMKYSSDSMLLSDIEYMQGKIDGKLLTYWNNGKLKRSDIYRQDTLVEGKCYTPKGNDTIYFPYIVYPQFAGGADSLKAYLKTNLHYPPVASSAPQRKQNHCI